MSRRILALAAFVAVLVTAPVATVGAAPRAPKACALLKRADIEPVVGTRVTRFAVEQDTPKSASICNWDVGAPASGALVSVWVQRGKPAREGYQAAVRLFGEDGEQLGDLGKQAFYSPRAGTVYVLDGSTLLYVQRLDATGATDPTALRDQAVELADVALDRL